MDYQWLLTSFDGRINRAKWWLGSAILFVAALIIGFLILPLIGLSLMKSYVADGTDPAVTAAAMRTGAIASLIMVVIFAYPTTALMVKRLHDRDRPTILAYVFWTPTVLNVILGLLGLSFALTEVNGVPVAAPSTLSWIVSLLGFVIGIWALVELGILKGTDGSNQYGPDPLAAQA